jgi:glucan phosphoethanolaminetransferase (alkaline phosphatase superfamily)
MRKPNLLIFVYILIIFIISIFVFSKINLDYVLFDNVKIIDIILSLLTSISFTLFIFIRKIDDILLKFKKSIEENFDALKKLTKYISENIKRIKNNENRKTNIK